MCCTHRLDPQSEESDMLEDTKQPDSCDHPLLDDEHRVTIERVDLDKVTREVRECLEDMQRYANLGPGHLLVIGGSSSEICGKRIGTASSLIVGQRIVDEVQAFAARCGFDVAYQCCEHLNRALVLERIVGIHRGYREVSAIPVPGAGGAIAAVAYTTLCNPMLVEEITAEAGIDIGDTLIGMHLRRVAVPIRGRRNKIGEAHVGMAYTRPPLIGGVRAVYDIEQANRRYNQA